LTILLNVCAHFQPCFTTIIITRRVKKRVNDLPLAVGEGGGGGGGGFEGGGGGRRPGHCCSSPCTQNGFDI